MTKLLNFARRLLNEKRGNVFIMTGFAIIPLVSATGIGIDYVRAARADTKLSAAADAAALAAVSDAMMTQSTAAAESYARAIFNQQAALLSDVTYDPNTLLVSVVEPTPGNREVTITFSGASRNLFGSMLGMNTLQVGGVAGSSASRAPNIDFYMLMDTSPSMALPVTAEGLQKMKDLTGCAFACHLEKPHSENIYIKDTTTFDIDKPMNSFNSATGNTTINADGDYVDGSGDIRNADGTYVDSVWLARNRKVPIVLRIDEERRAVTELVTYAKAQAASRGAAYRAALFSFNWGPNFTKVFPTGSTVITSDLDGIAAQAPNLRLMKYYVNGCPTSTFCNDDMATDFYTAFEKMKDEARVPTPGNGTNLAGDKPQGIIFIVTDGMSDEDLGGRTHRELRPQHLAQCTAIKARGLKIAILYTKYLKEALIGNGWSMTNVYPYVHPQDMVEDALTACASPGLRFTVTTNGDIAASLKQLFKEATKSAHLSK